MPARGRHGRHEEGCAAAGERRAPLERLAFDAPLRPSVPNVVQAEASGVGEKAEEARKAAAEREAMKAAVEQQAQ